MVFLLSWNSFGSGSPGALSSPALKKRESEWTFWAMRPREAPLTADARHTRAMTIALFIWTKMEVKSDFFIAKVWSRDHGKGKKHHLGVSQMPFTITN